MHEGLPYVPDRRGSSIHSPEDLISLMLGLTIACVIAVCLLLVLYRCALADLAEAVASEKEAWEQVNELRATQAVLLPGEQMEAF